MDTQKVICIFAYCKERQLSQNLRQFNQSDFKFKRESRTVYTNQ